MVFAHSDMVLLSLSFIICCIMRKMSLSALDERTKSYAGLMSCSVGLLKKAPQFKASLRFSPVVSARKGSEKRCAITIIATTSRPSSWENPILLCQSRWERNAKEEFAGELASSLSLLVKSSSAFFAKIRTIVVVTMMAELQGEPENRGHFLSFQSRIRGYESICLVDCWFARGALMHFFARDPNDSFRFGYKRTGFFSIPRSFDY